MHIESTNPISDHSVLKHSGRILPNLSISFISKRVLALSLNIASAFSLLASWGDSSGLPMVSQTR